MKTLIYPIVLLVLCCLCVPAGCSPGVPKVDPELEELYGKIDEAIQQQEIYAQQKERRIDFLRKRLSSERDRHFKIELVNDLIREFESYNSDSAQHYINLNLQLTRNLPDDSPQRLSLLIKKADVSSHAGLFAEAVELMKSINTERLDSSLLEDYYFTFSGIYQYQVEYSDDSEYTRNYSICANYTSTQCWRLRHRSRCSD